MNYQLKLDEIIASLNGEVKTLLLHACCAPCSSYVLEYLSKYFKITILYYNPNIYPETEYKRRKEELESFLPKRTYKYPVTLVCDEYNPLEYDEAVAGLEEMGEKSKRCYECYKFRLKRAYQYALEHHFDYFTTTLSISPYKISSWINEIGEELAKDGEVKFLYADFKKRDGYKRSLELSREYDLYRQDYCGCKYSKEQSKKE